MNQIFPTVISEQNILVVKNGRRLMVQRDHMNFNKILERIKDRNFNNIEQLFEVKDTLEKYFNVVIKNGKEVFYKGAKISNALSNKILTFYKNGLPFVGWVKFMDKLMENPSEYCRNQLFAYIEKHGLAICEDGFVYGYKAVRRDWYDHRTGKTHKYSVGKVVKMNRDKCETDERVGCGSGLHVSAADYLDKYYTGIDSNRYLLCRFSPKDAMSVPTDCNWEKLRLCKLRVMREIAREDVVPLGDSNVGKNGKNFKRNKLGRFC